MSLSKSLLAGAAALALVAGQALAEVRPPTHVRAPVRDAAGPAMPSSMTSRAVYSPLAAPSFLPPVGTPCSPEIPPGYQWTTTSGPVVHLTYHIMREADFPRLDPAIGSLPYFAGGIADPSKSEVDHLHYVARMFSGLGLGFDFTEVDDPGDANFVSVGVRSSLGAGVLGLTGIFGGKAVEMFSGDVWVSNEPLVSRQTDVDAHEWYHGLQGGHVDPRCIPNPDLGWVLMAPVINEDAQFVRTGGAPRLTWRIRPGPREVQALARAYPR